MRPYKEYKDSGVAWLGEMPKGWEIGNIGSVFQECNEKVSDKDYQPLSVTKKGIVPQLETVAKTDNGDERKLVRANDFVINSRSDRRGSCGISAQDGSVSLINTVLRPRRSNMDNLYYSFLFRSESFSDEFYRWGSGIVDDLWSTKWKSMKKISIPIPPFFTQSTIAAYLNCKTSAMDAVIADKLHLIALLKEKRQAVITRAVTKGLESTTPMKDSGVEWIGDIPAGWEVKPFTQLFAFGRGLSITKADFEDMGIPCVSYGSIHSRYGFALDTTIYSLPCVNEQYLRSSPDSLLNYGDFVFADTSEDIEGAGNFTYLNSDEPVFAGYHTIIAKNKNEQNCRYLAYLFESTPFRAQIRSKVFGIKVFSITQKILKSTKVILPHPQEQDSIVAYLDKKTTTIDTLVSDITTQIEKLKEYRQSMISEAVTGKVEL